MLPQFDICRSREQADPRCAKAEELLQPLRHPEEVVFFGRKHRIFAVRLAVGAR